MIPSFAHLAFQYFLSVPLVAGCVVQNELPNLGILSMQKEGEGLVHFGRLKALTAGWTASWPLGPPVLSNLTRDLGLPGCDV